jgi:PAS domain S-box-containing protein
MHDDSPALSVAEPAVSAAPILLVDDNPGNLLALRCILEDLNQPLVDAGSGEQALRLLEEREFAVVLLDVRMPGIGGFETAQRIRCRERTRHTPIIFLTAHEDCLAADQAYTLGAIDYLVKPLVPVILRAKVAGFIELFQKTDQVRRQAERLREMERRAFEQKLAEENARFRALTEHSSDAVTLVKADGTVLYSSPSSSRVLGYEPGEFVGRRGFEAVHPDDLERSLARLAELAANPGTPVMAELRVRHKDGSWRWMECVGTNLLGEPAVEAVVINYRDITERHRATEALRESEQRFARFMQHLPGLAWIKDLEGRYVFANDAAEAAFGMARDRLYGKTDDEVFPSETAAQFKANDRQALSSAGGIKVVETLQQPDGAVHHAVVSKFAIPGSDGKAALVGGTAIDITDLKRAEEALKEADKRKDEFLAMLAHELRNPLAPIRNAVHVIKVLGPPDPNLRRAEGLIERQVEHLARLVDDLLDVSRITRGKITLRKEALDLATVVARAVEASRPLIDARRHELTLTLTAEPIMVEGDATRLAQVVANLLNNAAKYTGEGGRIWLTVERRASQVEVRVRDNGMGIPADLLPHVFDLFTQGDRSLARSEGGLGIGLTLAKNLGEMHGGTLEAHSAGPGQGSEFVLRLPVVERRRGQAVETSEPMLRRAADIRRVLVVDDNADAAESLAMLLRGDGHEVCVTHDGPAALEVAGAFRPEVVLLDIGLPRMDGYEVARRLRRDVGLTQALVVALTGYGQQEDRRRAKEAGCDAHVVKPADLRVLHELLRRPSEVTR